MINIEGENQDLGIIQVPYNGKVNLYSNKNLIVKVTASCPCINVQNKLSLSGDTNLYYTIKTKDERVGYTKKSLYLYDLNNNFLKRIEINYG